MRTKTNLKFVYVVTTQMMHLWYCTQMLDSALEPNVGFDMWRLVPMVTSPARAGRKVSLYRVTVQKDIRMVDTVLRK